MTHPQKSLSLGHLPEGLRLNSIKCGLLPSTEKLQLAFSSFLSFYLIQLLIDPAFESRQSNGLPGERFKHFTIQGKLHSVKKELRYDHRIRRKDRVC
jgi:hypothetical protein